MEPIRSLGFLTINIMEETWLLSYPNRIHVENF